MTTPRVIRTIEELKAEDPSSIVLDYMGSAMTARECCRVPAVLVATGEQVSSAQHALWKAKRDDS